jgi:hypothetical protein
VKIVTLKAAFHKITLTTKLCPNARFSSEDNPM